MKKLFSMLLVAAMAFTLWGCQRNPELSFERTTFLINVGEEVSINPTVLNLEGEDLVNYVPADTTIVSVTNGVLKGLKEGETTVVATLKGYPDITQTLNVSVTKVAVTKVTISGDNKVRIGQDITLTAVVTPTSATYSTITWSSSDETVATVSSDGKVSGIALGDATITAAADGVSEMFEVEVIAPFVTAITISGASSMEIATTQTLKASIVPGEALNDVTWETSDATIATVEASGKVTAVKEGTVTITAKATDGSNVSATFSITVTDVSATAIELSADKTTVKVGDELDITATVTPSNAVYTITWSSSDTTIATVSSAGKVTPLKEGAVVITAKINDSVQDTINLTVTDYYKRVVVVDATLTEGATFVYEGNDYIEGKNAFTNLKDAVEAVNAGGTIVLKAGTYSDSVTINKALTITGPNKNIDANTDTRVEEAILTGTITLAAVTKFNINGVAFTGTGKIASTATLENVTIAYLNVYNKGEATSTWAETTGAVANAFISLFNASGYSSKIIIKNNKFDVRDCVVNIARSENVSVINNTFSNFERDAVRFDGGFNRGVYTISNNKFENEKLQGYNGIYFRTVGGVATENQEIYISNNTFKNIGTAGVNYSSAIATRNYQELGTQYEITYNVFENCLDYMKIRNNATAENHTAYVWSLNASMNKFYGVPTNNYFNCKNGSDADATNPTKAIFDHNFYADDKKNPIDITQYSAKFIGVLENKDNFATELEYSLYELGIEDPIDLVVNGNWSTSDANSKVTCFGKEFTLGTDAFATLAEAIAVAKANNAIYVCEGSYSENVTISVNGLKIYGANANVDPNNSTRKAESAFNDTVITLNAGIDGFKLQGLYFTGKSQVNVDAGTIKNLTVSYCNFDETTIASGTNGVIFGATDATTGLGNSDFTFYKDRFKASTNSRIIMITSLENTMIDGCYFETLGTLYADAVQIANLSGTFTIKNSEICKIGQYGLFLGKTSNTATKLDVINNVFHDFPTDSNTLGRAMDIRSYKAEVDAEVNVLYNTFYNFATTGTVLRIQHFAANEDYYKITINNNVFLGTPATIYSNAASEAVSTKANLENNYFEDADYASKVSGVTITNKFDSQDAVPTYPDAPTVNAREITILNEIETLVQANSHQLEWQVTPTNATNTKVVFSSSDTSIATVSQSGLITALQPGFVVITVTSEANENVEATMEFEVRASQRIEVELKGETTLETGGTASITPTIVGGAESDQVIWSSSDDQVLTVDSNGDIKAVKAGTAKIIGKLSSDENVFVEIEFTVIDSVEGLNELLQLFVQYNQSRVLTQSVKATGYQFVYNTRVYGSVSQYLFADLDITEAIAPISDTNRPGTKKTSTEFIVIHDTASSDPTATARAHSNYVSNGGGGTSWSYSVGNDGIYHQIPDDEISYHAGDGTAVAFALTDTGVKATDNGYDATVTIADGYYYINGQKTSVAIPVVGYVNSGGSYYWTSDGARNGSISGATTEEQAKAKVAAVTLTTELINDAGIHVVVGENGNYYMGKTYYNGTYNYISNRGGNLNSIGMETMVNQGSNLELTWHRAAKLAAKLCIENNLGVDRIKPHHFFSGKNCPQTMRDNNLWDEFLDMASAEYNIKNNYSDYTIEFVSNSPEYLDNTGMIYNAPAKTQTVSYTITVSKGADSKSITLTSIVEGTLNH